MTLPLPSPAKRPPLLIVQVGPPEPLDQPSAVYRTLQPCRALGELADVTVISGSILSPALFAPGLSGRAASGLLQAADILVIRDVGDPDLLPIIAARRRNGRLTIYELTSDILARSPLDGGAPAGDLVARSLPLQLARQADGLQLATPALETEFARLNPRRAIFPCELWEPPAPLLRPPRERVVIGWAGTRGERDDLALAIPALAGVLERHPEVCFSVMGDAELQAVLAPLPAARASLVPGGSHERTQRFLATIDIGIAPLAPTKSNRCRDDARFLEYAAHGVPAVCADLEPYRPSVRPGQTGFLFRDPTELEAVLERALAEPETRTAVTLAAVRIAAERQERPHAPDRLGFYLEVAAERGLRLGSSGRAGRPFPPPELTDPRQTPRVFAGSRYLALGAGRVERLLVEGWQQRAAGDAAEACRAFEDAELAFPESHLPPLLIGMTAAGNETALPALARAEALAPLSCQAPYQRGVRLLAAGDQAGAIAAFERARVLAPAFGAPQERLGALAEAAGQIAEATGLYEEAALQNGAFALPIARLAAIAQREGRLDKAVALLERSLTDDPELGVTNFMLGRAYLVLNRHHQARVHLQRALTWADAEETRPTPTREPLLASATDRATICTELARVEAEAGPRG